MCGNGLRCVVTHLAEASGAYPSTLAVATGAGVLESVIEWHDNTVTSVTVAMGPARLESPILPKGGPFIRQRLPGFGDLLATAVSMGNPHCVLLDTPPAEAGRLGPTLEVHPLFVQRTNVECVAPRSAANGGGLEVTVWERGVGLTLACGTGACAAVVASMLDARSPADEWVPVQLLGGVLDIKVAKDLSQVWLRGPVSRIYRGELA
jgi:diaminopimelate epimerase